MIAGRAVLRAPLGALSFLALSVPAPAGLAQKPTAPRPTRTAAAVPTATPSAVEEVYALGKDALAKGRFETAARLFRAVEDDPRLDADARYAFNRAQAARYMGDAGEAVHWYGRYLALDPNASDAAAVKEQIGKLVAAAPASVRAAALRYARADWARADAEVDRALSLCVSVRLLVQFVRAGSAPDPNASSLAFPARAVFWRAPAGESPDDVWEAWVVPTAPVAAPEDFGAPPHLFLPPGVAFPLAFSTNLVAAPALLAAAVPRGLPADPALATWRVAVAAEVDRLGPPLLLASGRPGAQATEVRSGPGDAALTLGRKKRDLPLVATPLSFGPRAVRADSKASPRVPFAVFDATGRDGSVERWGAPLSAFAVVNQLVADDPSKPTRFRVRADGTGPALATR